MIAHLAMLRSRCAHSKGFCRLAICVCMCEMFSMMMARLSTYIVLLHVIVGIWKWYPTLHFSSKRKSGSRKTMNKYGIYVSPCIVPLLI